MAISTVQKILGSVTRISQTEFKANYGDDAGNRQAGVFPSLRAAQALIEQTALSGKRGNWERAVREDGVESYLLKTIVNNLPSGLGYLTVNGSTVNVLAGLGAPTLAGFMTDGTPTAMAPGVIPSDPLVTDGYVWMSGFSYGGTALRLGAYAGLQSSFNFSTNVGVNAASYSVNNTEAVAVGNQAAYNNQGGQATAIGYRAGWANQFIGAVAVGWCAGYDSQQVNATAVGYRAGQYSQNTSAVAVGNLAGYNFQGIRATAVGTFAGAEFQQAYAVALGFQAGQSSQGANAIAIGYLAAPTSQHQSSIVLNASGITQASAATNSCVINPIRARAVSEQTTAMRTLAYDPSTKEVVSLSAAPMPAALGRYTAITNAVSPYTVTATDYFIDLTSGTATATLPTAVGIAGRMYHFKLSVAGQAFIVNTTSGQTIDDSSSLAAVTQWSTLSVISDGANWKAITATGFAAP